MPTWGTALLAAALATFLLAGVSDAQQIAHGVIWLLIGPVLLPVAFASALAVVAAMLTVVLTMLALPA